MSRSHARHLLLVSLAGCTLVACGGGGGDPPPPPPSFTVGGSISGLSGSVTLQNSGGGPLTLSANAPFTFPNAVASGVGYAVTVAAQPDLQTCSVANGNGTASANVTNIAITCADATPTLSLTLQPIKAVRLAWSGVPGVTHYKLREDPTGTSAFAQVGADLAASATSIEHIVPLHRRVNARYFVQACAASRCVDSNTVTLSGPLAAAAGYFKAAGIDEHDQFGNSIALSADGATLAVGVPFEDSSAIGTGGNPDDDATVDSGAVYVFAREGGGARWVQQAYLKAANAQARDGFGEDVALDSAGSLLAVGAPHEDSSGTDPNNNETFDAGAVYVFERAGGVWAQQAYVKASRPGRQDHFGSSVALSDQGQLAVAAPSENGGGSGPTADPVDLSVPDAGAVYVFFRQPSGDWRQDAYVKASNTDDSDRFGTSLALSLDGLTLAVGAAQEDSGATDVGGGQFDESRENSGAVYVFALGSQWLQQAYIKASNTGTGDGFGGSLAVSADGSTLAVGASGERSSATGVDGDQSDDSVLLAGAAYVFTRLGESWTQQAYIKASNTLALDNAGDSFAASLALSADGTTLAVGATLEDSAAIGIDGDDSDNSTRQSGAAFVFERSNDSWAQRAYLKPSNTRAFFQFGESIALSGDAATIAVGATAETGSATGIDGDQNSPPVDGAGAVYLY